MTSEQASKVIAVLAAGFPAVTLELASTDLFLDSLQELGDHELALDVALKIVKTRPRFPALSELLDAYHGARRRREAAAAPPAPRPERDPELAAAIRAFAEALKSRNVEEPITPLALPVAAAGPCDDGCGRVGDRVQAGALQLCEPCALARSRVAAKLEGHPEPDHHREAVAA